VCTLASFNAVIVHLHTICPVHCVYSGGADDVNMLGVAAK